jgi:hypothetical protein
MNRDKEYGALIPRHLLNSPRLPSSLANGFVTQGWRRPRSEFHVFPRVRLAVPLMRSLGNSCETIQTLTCFLGGR